MMMKKFDIIFETLIELAIAKKVVNITNFCNLLKAKNLIFSIYGNKKEESNIYFYLGEISNECKEQGLPIITTVIDFKTLKPFYRLEKGLTPENERVKVFNFNWENLIPSELNEIQENKREVVVEARVNFPTELKNQILQRANFKCQNQNCISPNSFKAKNGETFLEIHHIIPYSKCKTHSLENCIALCPNCHRQVHFGNTEDVKLK